MPIRKELLKQHYGKDWINQSRPRILLRAGNQCEQCGVPNHARVLRAAGWWSTAVILVKDDSQFANVELYTKQPQTLPLFWTPPTGPPGDYHGFPPVICRVVQIVLTISHLNHVAGDDREENLKALCQWCHLNFDKLHHAETRARRKDAARPLFT